MATDVETPGVDWEAGARELILAWPPPWTLFYSGHSQPPHCQHAACSLTHRHELLSVQGWPMCSQLRAHKHGPNSYP